MTTNTLRKTTRVSLLGMLAATAICFAACSNQTDEVPGAPVRSVMAPPKPQRAQNQKPPAAPGTCKIDAVKMCQATGGGSANASKQQPGVASSYGSSNMPDSVEFQIPAGQAIKLMCYYDPQHTSVYRADATPESPLTGNSVDYLKKQGFCTNK